MDQEIEFTVVSRGGVKTILPIDDHDIAMLDCGTILSLKPQPKMHSKLKVIIPPLIKELLQKELKIISFEDSRRRHGFWVIIDVITQPSNKELNRKEIINSASFFVEDDFKEYSNVKDYVITLIRQLVWSDMENYNGFKLNESGKYFCLSKKGINLIGGKNGKR